MTSYTGPSRSVDECRRNRGLGEAFTAAAEEAGLAGISLLDAAGNIDTTTAAGSALFDQANSVRDSMGQVAAAAFDAAGGFDNLGPAQDAAAAAADGVRESFIAQATVALGSRDAAVALANSLGMIPSVVATAITQPGMDAAQLNLLTVASQIQSLPPNTNVDVTALTDEARGRLIDLGIVVQTLPDGTVVAYASTDAARNELDDLTRPRTVTISTVTVGGTVGHQAEGGIRSSARYMAGGGVLGMWAAGRAAIFPPNQEVAVIGDRKADLEAYLPLNPGVAAYQNLLVQAAHAMHREVVPDGTIARLSALARVPTSRPMGMADGGIVGSASSYAASDRGGGVAGNNYTFHANVNRDLDPKELISIIREQQWLTGGGSL